MLKATRFFEDIKSVNPPPPLDIKQKLSRLMDIYIDGEHRLRKNRAVAMKKYQAQYKNFMQSEKLTVTAETQTGLSLIQ